MNTSPAFIQFAQNQTYTINLSYRILAASVNGFGFNFASGAAAGQGIFLPGSLITGATGTSGTTTLSGNTGPYSDVRVSFAVIGAGAIAIDDIRVSDSSGHVLTSENAEGPTIVGGPLKFQLTDGIALLTDANSTVRSALARDLDGDGYPEVILTLTAPNPSTTPLSPIVVSSGGPMKIATGDFFPGGAPTVKHSPVTLFADINNDGLEDILFADAGSDGTPTPTGSRIGVAFNLGGGRFQNVSSLIPSDQQTTRSYSLAAGEIDADGHVEIIVPDDQNGTSTAVLRWNGVGFDEQRNWIASSLWTQPTNLGLNDWMSLADFDQDGRLDLLVGAAPIPGIPNLRLLFGGPSGFGSDGLIQLPDGLFGHAVTNQGAAVQTADLGPMVVADFNNDGMPDIFVAEEQTVAYQPGVYMDQNDPYWMPIYTNGGVVFEDVGFQVLINRGSRQFNDVTSTSTAQNLGRRHYFGLIPIDMNNDGFTDVVGLYTTKAYGNVAGGQYGTTLFLNDGTGAFQVIDGTQLLASITTSPSNGQQWNLGAFIPTTVTNGHTEGVVFESVGGCSVGSFCDAEGLNLYKVTASASIGTGPNFLDSAALGVPGFNEFYYLRHYPDAAAAVQAGLFPTGLAHYLAVGKTKGYAPHAPNAARGLVQPGWWWDSKLNGMGFFIEAGGSSGNGLFMGGFMSDSAGNPTWLVSIGQLNGTTYTGRWLHVTGGQTLVGPYVAPLPFTDAGAVSINFSDPTHAVMIRPDGSQINIERYSFSTKPIPPPGAAGQNGWWWSTLSGTGYGIETQGNMVFIVAYVYDDSGNPMWYLATGALANSTTYAGSWDLYRGAPGPTLTSPEGIYADQKVAGSIAMTLAFTDATHAMLTMGGTTIPLVRYQSF